MQINSVSIHFPNIQNKPQYAQTMNDACDIFVNDYMAYLAIIITMGNDSSPSCGHDSILYL